MKDDPTTGSPPIPTIVELPRPSWVSSWPIWYVSVPERETRPIDPSLKISAGDDPDVRLAGREDAGAVRADERDVAALDVVVDTQHLVRGDVLGDADDRADPGVDGLVDRVRRVRAGTKTSDVFACVSSTASRTVLKTGMPSTSWPPLPGVTPATTFVP